MDQFGSILPGMFFSHFEKKTNKPNSMVINLRGIAPQGPYRRPQWELNSLL